MPSAHMIQAGVKARQIFLLGGHSSSSSKHDERAKPPVLKDTPATFENTAFILFDNQAFWSTLAVSADEYSSDVLVMGSLYNDPSYVHVALGRLHRLLSVSRTVRGELLEFPLAVSLQNAVVPTGRALEAQRRLRRKGGAMSVTIDRAEALLFVKPESILHRAVQILVGYYDPQHPGRTTLYAGQAAKRFAFSLESMQTLRTKNSYLPRLLPEEEDPNFHMSHAAHYAGQLPFMQACFFYCFLLEVLLLYP
jgi:hypothetical protein